MFQLAKLMGSVCFMMLMRENYMFLQWGLVYSLSDTGWASFDLKETLQKRKEFANALLLKVRKKNIIKPNA